MRILQVGLERLFSLPSGNCPSNDPALLTFFLSFARPDSVSVPKTCLHKFCHSSKRRFAAAEEQARCCATESSMAALVSPCKLSDARPQACWAEKMDQRLQRLKRRSGSYMFMSTKQYKTSTMDSQRVQKQTKKKGCKQFCICAFHDASVTTNRINR